MHHSQMNECKCVVQIPEGFFVLGLLNQKLKTSELNEMFWNSFIDFFELLAMN